MCATIRPISLSTTNIDTVIKNATVYATHEVQYMAHKDTELARFGCAVTYLTAALRASPDDYAEALSTLSYRARWNEVKFMDVQPNSEVYRSLFA